MGRTPMNSALTIISFSTMAAWNPNFLNSGLLIVERFNFNFNLRI